MPLFASTSADDCERLQLHELHLRPAMQIADQTEDGLGNAAAGAERDPGSVAAIRDGQRPRRPGAAPTEARGREGDVGQVDQVAAAEPLDRITVQPGRGSLEGVPESAVSDQRVAAAQAAERLVGGTGGNRGCRRPLPPP
jgi:hypothetical protein